MKLTLIEAKIQETLRKNRAVSYGLTLVAGLPFPANITTQIQAVQGRLEGLLPDRFAWYGPEQLHVTLFAPLRGRYRESPLLQRTELPANLDGFANDLNIFFGQQPPFSLALAGVRLTPEGNVLITEKSLAQQLAAGLQKYPELDLPKHLRGRQVVIGYFNTGRPFASAEEEARLADRGLIQMADISIGQMTVRRVWLVHYANRTLNRVVGKVGFDLGQPNSITAARLIEALGIVGG